MSYAYQSRDGLVRSNDAAMIDTWESIGREHREREHAWVDELRSRGVKAAHPDDGWVDRKADTVQLVYPQFNAGIDVGDLIALGRPDKYRIVRITGKRDVGIICPAVRYSFVAAE